MVVLFSKFKNDFGLLTLTVLLYLFLEGEIYHLVETLKAYMAKTMRIEMAPWAKAYTVDLKDIYTELTLDKIENQPTGPEGKRLNDYKELFEGMANQQQPKEKSPKKVLMKGDPGMGKTTVNKKMSWDWAMGLFKVFNLVFLISLKLVRPGDAIENVIIDQYPVLESLNVSKQKVRHILENYGNRILIILDGLDEYEPDGNGNLYPVFKGKILKGCSVLVTSKPCTVTDI